MLLNFKYLSYEKVTIHFTIPKTPGLSILAPYFLSYFILKVGSYFWDIMYKNININNLYQVGLDMNINTSSFLVFRIISLGLLVFPNEFLLHKIQDFVLFLLCKIRSLLLFFCACNTALCKEQQTLKCQHLLT